MLPPPPPPPPFSKLLAGGQGLALPGLSLICTPMPMLYAPNAPGTLTTFFVLYMSKIQSLQILFLFLKKSEKN